MSWAVGIVALLALGQVRPAMGNITNALCGGQASAWDPNGWLGKDRCGDLVDRFLINDYKDKTELSESECSKRPAGMPFSMDLRLATMFLSQACCGTQTKATKLVCPQSWTPCANPSRYNVHTRIGEPTCQGDERADETTCKYHGGSVSWDPAMVGEECSIDRNMALSATEKKDKCGKMGGEWRPMTCGEAMGTLEMLGELKKPCGERSQNLGGMNRAVSTYLWAEVCCDDKEPLYDAQCMDWDQELQGCADMSKFTPNKVDKKGQSCRDEYHFWAMLMWEDESCKWTEAQWKEKCAVKFYGAPMSYWFSETAKKCCSDKRATDACRTYKCPGSSPASSARARLRSATAVLAALLLALRALA